MKKRKLIYIMDPHCGWCYANERSIKDLHDYYKDEFEFEVLSGGMWKGNNVKRGGEAMYDFILPSVIRINQYHNVEIGGPYLDLISDSTYMLSSEWPSKAMMAVALIEPEQMLDYSYNLMRQHFKFGKRYDIEKTYVDALEGIEIDKKKFIRYWKSEEVNEKTVKMFERACELTRNYPSLILQDGETYSELQKGIFTIASLINKIEAIKVQ